MKRPNILVIMSDQHTPSVLGAYGNARVKTPSLDKMAADGVVFENGYCNNPICVPSRMSSLTGLLSHKIDVWNNGDALPPQLATWPLMLRLAGYETVISGRNHLLWGDRLGGFQRRLFGDAGRTIPLLQPGKPSVQKVPQGILTALGAADNSGHARHDEQATARAEDYLRAGPDGPFALFVGCYQPHAPFVAPPRFFSMYEDFEPVLAEEPFDPVYAPLAEVYERAALFPEKLKTAVKAYYAMVSHVDHMVGRLLDALKQTGLLDNTVVLYTSDHGEMLGRHRLWHKNCFYEDSVRVPLIVMNSGRFGSGRRLSQNVSLLDLFPTFLDWAEYDCDLELDGESLAPVLAHAGGTGRDAVVAEYIGMEPGRPGRMVKRGHHKLILYHETDPVLFDLAEDPLEQVNVARDPRYRRVRDRLTAEALRDWDPDAVTRTMYRNLRHVRFHHAVSRRT